MFHWFKENIFCSATAIIILLVISIIGAQIAHYNLEDEHKIYVEYVIYDHGHPRQYSGTYDIIGDNFKVMNYWRSAGKHSGSYRVVSIVDGNAWWCYMNKQSVCIYTGLNDVEIKTIKVVE